MSNVFFIGSVFSNRYCQCTMIISRQRGHIKGVKVQVRVLLESQNAEVYQLVDSWLPKPKVAESCSVYRSNKKEVSVMVNAGCLYHQDYEFESRTSYYKSLSI